MNPILFLSLVIILSAALPWWPYSAYGRSRHHRRLLDTPSSIDFKAAAEAGTRRVHQTWLDKQHADETKIIDQQHEALDRGPTPECDSNSEWDQLLRQFEEGWVAGTTNSIDDGCVAADGPTEPAGDNAPSSKEQRQIGHLLSAEVQAGSPDQRGQQAVEVLCGCIVGLCRLADWEKGIQSGVFEGKSFSIFDDGSIEIETGSGLQEFKDFAELRAVAAARISHDGTGQTNPRSQKQNRQQRQQVMVERVGA